MTYEFDKDEIKNSLTIYQVMDLVTILGANPSQHGDILVMETICHNNIGESNGKKLYYYDNTKLFKCYTDCGEIFDIFQLICKAKKIQVYEEWELPKAVSYVAIMFGYAPNKVFEEETLLSEFNSILKDYEMLLKKQQREVIDIEHKLYDDMLLYNLPFIPCKEWLEEGITIETMQKYGIKYYGKEHKIVIPHYNVDNKLIGIRGRTMIREEAERYGKYMPLKVGGIQYNHPLSYNLYGLNLNIENIKRAKSIIIFEGK